MLPSSSQYQVAYTESLIGNISRLYLVASRPQQKNEMLQHVASRLQQNGMLHADLVDMRWKY